MEWQEITQSLTPACLAAFGGVIGALKTSLKDTHKSWLMRALDVVTAAIFSASVADYLVPENFPKMALALGLVVGSIGANLIDAFHALTPTIAKGVVDAFLARLGYEKK